MAKTYKFDEETTTSYKGSKYTCKMSKKYAETKKKATEIINSGKYDLTENDFWTLKQYINSANENVCLYNGLIISHNGCLKINDKLEHPFLSKCCTEPIEFTYFKKSGKEIKEVKGYRQVYSEAKNAYVVIDENTKARVNGNEDIYEVGEISTENLMNDYPFAMLLKRLFDRVVLKKSKLAFMGIMSEAEIDDKQDMTTMFEGVDVPSQELIDKFNALPNQAKAQILNLNHTTDVKTIKVDVLKTLVENAK